MEKRISLQKKISANFTVPFQSRHMCLHLKQYKKTYCKWQNQQKNRFSFIIIGFVEGSLYPAFSFQTSEETKQLFLLQTVKEVRFYYFLTLSRSPQDSAITNTEINTIHSANRTNHICDKFTALHLCEVI